MATIVSVIAGVLLILVAARDVFHTLFHPARTGKLSDWIARQMWRSLRTLWPQALSFAGPGAFVITVVYWAVSVVVGFALIYLPWLPRAFTFVTGLNPSHYASFLAALDVSIGSLITLSTGVYSTNLWLQCAMGIESIFGFGLLIASVSWILSIYPILEHRKSLAHEATLLHFSEAQGIQKLENASDSDIQEILLGLALQLITNRNELMQFPITYYFHENENKTSLAGILPYLADLAEQNVNRKGAAGLAATALGGAVDDYLKSIAQMFLHRDFTNREDILRAFAHEHMREMVHSPQRRPRAA